MSEKLRMINALLGEDFELHELWEQSPEFHASITAIVTTLPLVVQTAADQARRYQTQRAEAYDQITRGLDPESRHR
jgi:hypothetical protein